MSSSLMRRFFHWFWQGDVLAQTRKEVAAKSHRRKKLEQYAMTAAEVGERALNPVTPLRAGSGDVVAALLYTESIRASLLALDKSVGDLAADDSLRADLGRFLPKEVSLNRLSELVSQPSDMDELEGNLRVRASEARALARVANLLLESTRAAEHRVQRALSRRALRVGSAVILLVVLVVVGIKLGVALSLRPDLAEGKAWRASSSYDGFSAEEGICDGEKTRIFFHTNREAQPWIELDLGEETLVERVDVKNRRDCCTDRAYPLAVEGSLDGKHWQELARRTLPFSSWTAKFRPVNVRFVRVKALRRTFFHLESVEVR